MGIRRIGRVSCQPSWAKKMSYYCLSHWTPIFFRAGGDLVGLADARLARSGGLLSWLDPSQFLRLG
jgi:hypothetical protein